jgi:hypothetical protein
METMFGRMMEGCMKGMSAEDRQKMIGKMSAMCPCIGKDLSEEGRKAIQEKMKAFCGSKMELFAACFSKSEPAAGKREDICKRP